MMAFAPTRQVLRELFGWAPAPRSILRMIDTVGAEARGFLEGPVNKALALERLLWRLQAAAGTRSRESIRE